MGWMTDWVVISPARLRGLVLCKYNAGFDDLKESSDNIIIKTPKMSLT